MNHRVKFETNIEGPLVIDARESRTTFTVFMDDCKERTLREEIPHQMLFKGRYTFVNNSWSNWYLAMVPKKDLAWFEASSTHKLKRRFVPFGDVEDSDFELNDESDDTPNVDQHFYCKDFLHTVLKGKQKGLFEFLCKKPGMTGVPVYLGKSKNLETRVKEFLVTDGAVFPYMQLALNDGYRIYMRLLEYVDAEEEFKEKTKGESEKETEVRYEDLLDKGWIHFPKIYLLEKYDYAWNIQENSGYRDVLRLLRA